MPDNRLLAQLQHAIQYPALHLDPRVSAGRPECPINGPAFEMSADDSRPEANTHPEELAPQPAIQPAETPITAADSCKRFVTGGRAIFTLQGATSRYTFRVNRKDPACDSCKVDVPEGTRKCPACDRLRKYPAATVYFVSLLTGPDNLDDYTYAGLLDVRTGTIKLTRSSKYTEDSTPIRAFNWAIARLWRGLPLPQPAGFYHIGRCARCGRALTVPSSIESGFGPECLGKLDGGV